MQRTNWRNKSIITEEQRWKRLKHSGQLYRRLKITPVPVTCYSSPLSPEKSKITLITPLLRPSNRFLCSVRKAVSTTAIYLHRGEYVFSLFFPFVRSSNIYSEKSIWITRNCNDLFQAIITYFVLFINKFFAIWFNWKLTYHYSIHSLPTDSKFWNDKKFYICFVINTLYKFQTKIKFLIAWIFMNTQLCV